MPTLTAVQTEQTEASRRESELLTAIANEAHVSREDLRWFAVGGANPRSIVIVKRGANKQTVKTISRTNNPEAWESWLPVLAQLQTEKQTSGKKRVSHDKIPVGKI